MRVGVVQMNTAVVGSGDRLEEIASHAAACARAGAQIVLFPEMALPGYSLDWRDMRRTETIPGKSTDELVNIARSLDIVIVAGFGERHGGNFYNSLVAASRSGLLPVYRKINVSSAERACWHPGSDAVVVDTPVGRIGLGICADLLWTRPWTDYRRRVDLVAIASCWPDWYTTTPALIHGRTRRFHRQAVRTLPERISQALGVPVLFANACGPLDSRLPVVGGRLRGQFAAGSRIVNRGETVIDDRGEGAVEQLIGNIDPGRRSANETLFDSWIGSLTARAQLQGLDRLSAWISVPAYELRRRQVGRQPAPATTG